MLVLTILLYLCIYSRDGLVSRLKNIDRLVDRYTSWERDCRIVYDVENTLVSHVSTRKALCCVASSLVALTVYPTCLNLPFSTVAKGVVGPEVMSETFLLHASLEQEIYKLCRQYRLLSNDQGSLYIAACALPGVSTSHIPQALCTRSKLSSLVGMALPRALRFP